MITAHYSSKSSSWNTPPTIIEAAIRSLGRIDLDPCSNCKKKPNIPAKVHYTKTDDGLEMPWFGNVYCNPPYGRQIAYWIKKAVDCYESGLCTQAILLVPARTETRWFRHLSPYLKCFIFGRLRFGDSQQNAPFPSAVAYLGPKPATFAAAFSLLGDICCPYRFD